MAFDDFLSARDAWDQYQVMPIAALRQLETAHLARVLEAGTPEAIQHYGGRCALAARALEQRLAAVPASHAADRRAAQRLADETREG